MRVYRTSFLCVFLWTILSSRHKSSLRQCASIQMLISLATYVLISCSYNMATTVSQDQDCYRWNNAPNMLCYECDSCKAGVLEDIKRDWHKLSVLNIVMLVILIGVYSIGCCAFRNTQRAETITRMVRTG